MLLLQLDRQHYFTRPEHVAQAIRNYLQILESYNTFRPPHVYDIFTKIKQKMTTLDASGMEAQITHEDYRYKERIPNDAGAYHALLERYTTQLHTVLEMSDTEMNSLTQFANARDSEQFWELEWQNKVRILLDLHSKFLTSTFRGGELCYPPSLIFGFMEPHAVDGVSPIAVDGQDLKLKLARLKRMAN